MHVIRSTVIDRKLTISNLERFYLSIQISRGCTCRWILIESNAKHATTPYLRLFYGNVSDVRDEELVISEPAAAYFTGMWIAHFQ